MAVSNQALETIAGHKAWTPAHKPLVEALSGARWNDLPQLLADGAKKLKLKMPIGLVDTIMKAVAIDDPSAPAAVDRKGNAVLQDGSKMIERIVLSEDVDQHMADEVLPFAPDAVWDTDAAKVGYEVPVTRIFFKPAELRSLDEIDADVQSVIVDLNEKFKAVRA